MDLGLKSQGRDPRSQDVKQVLELLTVNIESINKRLESVGANKIEDVYNLVKKMDTEMDVALGALQKEIEQITAMSEDSHAENETMFQKIVAIENTLKAENDAVLKKVANLEAMMNFINNRISMIVEIQKEQLEVVKRQNKIMQER